MKSQVIGWWWVKKSVLNGDGDSPPVSSLCNSLDEKNNINMPASDVVTNIKKEALNLKSKFMSEDGLVVNYYEMSRSEDLIRYEKITHQLQHVNLAELSLCERKALLINIYNSLVIHALARNTLNPASAVSTLVRMKFYATNSYCIGGHAYCLNDIENGLLRGNRVSPVPFTSPPFSTTDPRRIYSIPCDPRIHFALNCGAKSCPPISVYASDEVTLNSQLQMATELFLDNNVSIQVQDKCIHLSKLFEWYRVDFGSNDEEVLAWIKNHASLALSEKLQSFLNQHKNVVLKYDNYDWALNG